MEPLVLSDKKVFPTDEVIFSHIGTSKPLWIELFDFLHSEYPDLTPQWRYYNDGKSWLMKMSRKAKTIFWLGVTDGSFRITSYFTDRAKKDILSSGLSVGLKRGYQKGKTYGKLRGITITFKHARDLKDAKTLIALKLAAR